MGEDNRPSYEPVRVSIRGVEGELYFKGSPDGIQEHGVRFKRFYVGADGNRLKNVEVPLDTEQYEELEMQYKERKSTDSWRDNTHIILTNDLELKVVTSYPKTDPPCH